MISSLKMKCFRKHEDRVFSFSKGLVTLRAGNECGKSTLLEGIAYALFGTKALRNSLEEVVTWGNPVKALKVELTLSMDGKTYVITRAKGGAEVVLDGKVFVTGQNEVSNFCAALLGADANTATQLMLANQGNLRGVLEEGPKATGSLVESLSDLGVIERILDAAQEKWQLGSTGVLEERLKAAIAQRDAVVIPDQPDAAAHAETVATLERDLAETKDAAAKALANYEGLRAQVLAENEKRDQAKSLQAALAGIAAQRPRLLTDAVPSEIVVPDIEAIERELRMARDAEATRVAYADYRAIPRFNVVMARADFEAARKATQATAKRLQTEYNAANADLKVLRSKQTTSFVCPTCGQDTSHLPNVREMQETITASIADLEARIAHMVEDDEANDRRIAELDEIEANDRKVQQARRPAQALFENGFIPAQVTWVGDIPPQGPIDVASVKARLDEAKALERKAMEVQARVASAKRSLAQLDEQEAEVRARIGNLALMSDDDFDVLNARFLEASQAKDGLRVDTIEDALRQVKADFDQTVRAWQEAVGRKAMLDDNAKQVEADIREIGENNALVKKLRTARPMISAKIWGIVLTSVSVLFSQMRGEQSLVAREKDGFTVNGKSVDSLSGSAKDLLGLAIRVALLRMFLPNCPFLLLDEAAAACDSERTASLVGFIAGAGIPQIILATHESTSTAVADNLIEI